MSLFVVVVACSVVGLVEAVVGFPPFLIFALAVATAVWRAGFAPGLLAALVAALATDFFFVDPRFRLSLNHQVLVLGGVYVVSAAIAQASLYRATQRSVHLHEKDRN